MTGPQELVDRALAISLADGCIVIAEESSSANLRWANNTLTTNGVTEDRHLTVIATMAGSTGTAAGVVSRSGVTADSVETVVRSAEAAARAGVAAEDAESLVSGAEQAGWDDPPDGTSIDVFVVFAPALSEAFGQARANHRVLFGYAEHDVTTTYVGSSSGLRARHAQRTGHVELNAKSPDFARSAWAGAATADFGDVDISALHAQVAERLGWAERSVELPAGRYETLLPPSAVADLMVCLYWAAGAREAHDGRSVFSRPGGGTRVGERLTDTPVTLRSDPMAAGLGCAPFVISHASGPSESVFDNGLDLGVTPWISDGSLASLLQTRHTAAMTALPVTPGIDNLILEGPAGGPSLEAMMGTTEKGLLLTCLWYIREVDPRTLLLTGLTRDGVYLIERGEVVGAVNNFRFNESPVALLGRLLEVGSTARTLPRELCDYFTRTAMPTLRVADFNMSSVSPAT
jgi:predicted Zn-dependent protease